MKEITPLRNSNRILYNINNVTYNLKQLILATNNFRKNDVDIYYAPTGKRTSVYVTNNCYLQLEGDVAMILVQTTQDQNREGYLTRQRV